MSGIFTWVFLFLMTFYLSSLHSLWTHYLFSLLLTKEKCTYFEYKGHANSVCIGTICCCNVMNDSGSHFRGRLLQITLTLGSLVSPDYCIILAKLVKHLWLVLFTSWICNLPEIFLHKYTNTSVTSGKRGISHAAPVSRETNQIQLVKTKKCFSTDRSRTES